MTSRNGYFPGKKPAKRSAIITPRTAQETKIAAMPRQTREVRQALAKTPPLRVGGADLVEGADRIMRTPAEHQAQGVSLALLQRLAAVRGRLSLCADQAAAAKWWLSMPMASVSAEGPMPKALSTRRTSPLMPGCRHQGRACPLRRARMTSNPLIVA